MKTNHPMDPFREDLKCIERHLERQMGAEHPLVREIAEHIVFSGGKRIRPVLTVASARLFGASNEELYRLSTVPEYLHAASLLHDDVVDQGEIRRGRPAAYTVWGNSAAILVGDYLYARAIELASSFNIPDIDNEIAHTVKMMAEGEVIQLIQSRDPHLDKDTYYSIVERKTGALIAASCAIGAIWAGAPQHMVKAISNFGMLIGKAFQIKDDLLDYTADQDSLGKAIGTDLKEGKITLPLIFGIEASHAEERERLMSIMGNGALTQEDVVWVRGHLSSTGATKRTFQTAKGLIDNALKELDQLPASEQKDYLAQMARYILERKR